MSRKLSWHGRGRKGIQATPFAVSDTDVFRLAYILSLNTKQFTERNIVFFSYRICARIKREPSPRWGQLSSLQWMKTPLR